jgi:arginase
MAGFASAFYFPIWQGAGEPQGYRYGAEAVASLVKPHLPLTAVAVDDADFSPARFGVKAYDSIVRHLQRAQHAIDGLPEPIMVLGGDCMCDYVPIIRALNQHGDSMALLWVDAHGDIHTPETSPSANFHGMLLRCLIGHGPEDFVQMLCTPLHPRQLFYVGLRDPEPEEAEYLAQHGITNLPAEAVNAHNWGILIDQLKERGFSKIYIHVDSDVLDPADFPSAAVIEPNGIRVAALVPFLQALRAQFTVVGGAFTEYNLPSEATPSQLDLARNILHSGFGIG